MYEIFMNGKCVGNVKVKKEGLYYLFTCTCLPPDTGFYRIKVGDGNREVDLGICVPVGTKFGLTSRVPTKYLKGDSFIFTLVTNRAGGVPVASGEAFLHLDKIETARLEITDGRPQIIIDPESDLQDSGLIQECPNI